MYYREMNIPNILPDEISLCDETEVARRRTDHRGRAEARAEVAEVAVPLLRVPESGQSIFQNRHTSPVVLLLEV